MTNLFVHKLPMTYLYMTVTYVNGATNTLIHSCIKMKLSNLFQKEDLV